MSASDQPIVHTPGPWRVRKDDGDHWGMREVVGPSLLVRGFTVATNVSPQMAAQIEKDARLIAAAPDLLAACEYTLDAIAAMRDGDGSCISPAVMYLRLAIEKATNKVV